MPTAALPLSIKLTVMLVVMSENILSFMMPVLMVYMVERLGARNSLDTSDFQVISFWVGVLESANRIFAFVGSLSWGYISDKIGRKTSMIILLLGKILTSLGLGLSPNLWWAITWRMVAGFFAGTIPILKAMIRDISDDTNISVLYGYFSSGSGAASILAPLIAGFLSRPVQTDLGVFDNEFINMFPYFYPMIVHVFNSCWAIVLIYKYFPNKIVSSSESSTKNNYSLFLTEKNYLIATFIYIMIALSQYWYKSILALWLRLDQTNQGLGWDTEFTPGLMNALSGFILLFFPIIFTSRIQNKFGVRGGLIFLAFLHVIPLTCISYGYLISDSWLMIFLVVMNGLLNALTTVLLSFISICVSNSVTGTVAGAAIGLAQAFSALGRGVGNWTGAILFGYLVEENFGFPFDFHLTFFLVIFIVLSVAGITKVFFDESIEKRKTNKVEIPLIKKE